MRTRGVMRATGLALAWPGLAWPGLAWPGPDPLSNVVSCAGGWGGGGAPAAPRPGLPSPAPAESRCQLPSRMAWPRGTAPGHAPRAVAMGRRTLGRWGGGARRCCSCCSCWTYCSFFSTSVFQENQFISQRLGQRLSGYQKSRCFFPSLDPRAEQCKFYYKTLHLSVRQNLAQFQRTASALDPATLTNAFLVLLVTGPKLMFLLIARMSGDV